MTMTTPRPAILSIVFMALFAVGADAADGWILWMRTLAVPEPKWAPWDGFATVAECKKAAADSEASIKNAQNEDARKQAAITSFACFPSDFDPRPKAPSLK